MGATIGVLPARSPNTIRENLTLIKRAASERYLDSKKGRYNRSKTEPVTVDIEQEYQIVDRETGMPVSVESLYTNPGTRPDTSVFNIEIDGWGKEGGYHLTLSEEGIRKLYHSLQKRTRTIQKSLPESSMVVAIGMHPLLTGKEWNDWIVRDLGRYRRYTQIDSTTFEENPSKVVSIQIPTGEIISERASYLPAMFRCSGTQFQFAENSVENALKNHMISRHISPIMRAVFGNSPFTNSLDTGRGSSRAVWLDGSEQLRAGLPKPADDLWDYYKEVIEVQSPFMILDDAGKALDLAHGATHRVSRIMVDEAVDSIRIEIRHVDSQAPFAAIQALLMTRGCMERLGANMHMLPAEHETQANFQNAVWGIRYPNGEAVPMSWHGKTITTQALGVELLEQSLIGLKSIGLEKVGHEFLHPLRGQIQSGRLQSDSMRQSYHRQIRDGASSQEALVNILQMRHQETMGEEIT